MRLRHRGSPRYDVLPRDDHSPVACTITKDLKPLILYRVEEDFAASGVVHELLHLERYLVSSVPQLQPVTTDIGGFVEGILQLGSVIGSCLAGIQKRSCPTSGRFQGIGSEGFPLPWQGLPLGGPKSCFLFYRCRRFRRMQSESDCW
jgi:hypothetical protein